MRAIGELTRRSHVPCVPQAYLRLRSVYNAAAKIVQRAVRNHLRRLQEKRLSEQLQFHNNADYKLLRRGSLQSNVRPLSLCSSYGVLRLPPLSYCPGAIPSTISPDVH